MLRPLYALRVLTTTYSARSFGIGALLDSKEIWGKASASKIRGAQVRVALFFAGLGVRNVVVYANIGHSVFSDDGGHFYAGGGFKVVTGR